MNSLFKLWLKWMVKGNLLLVWLKVKYNFVEVLQFFNLPAGMQKIMWNASKTTCAFDTLFASVRLRYSDWKLLSEVGHWESLWTYLVSTSFHPFLFRYHIMGVCWLKTSLQLYSTVHVIHNFLDCGEIFSYFLPYKYIWVFSVVVLKAKSKGITTILGPSRVGEINFSYLKTK